MLFRSLVFALDVLKAVIACLLCSLIANSGSGITPIAPMAVMYAGLGVVLGHNFPFYLGFKGGKGIAATCGIIFSLNLVFAAIIFPIALVVIGVSKFVSLGSLCIVTMVPILLVIFKYSPEVIILALCMAVIAFYQHRKNIVKLANGTESKFSLRSNKKGV